MKSLRPSNYLGLWAGGAREAELLLPVSDSSEKTPLPWVKQLHLHKFGA